MYLKIHEMNKELKYIDDIDYVLHFLATSPYAKGQLSDAELWEYIKSTEKRMSGDRVVKILNKLTNDKYVEIYNSPLEKFVRYKISFDGLLQDELGGYRTKYLENNKLKNIQKWQFWLTLIIAIGAIFASIYYILEIIKFFSKCN